MLERVYATLGADQLAVIEFLRIGYLVHLIEAVSIGAVVWGLVSNLSSRAKDEDRGAREK